MTDPFILPPLRRRLIVNADDFGQSPGVNEGIAYSHLHGVVSSASLMVRWPASGEAAEYAVDHPDLSLGLHADLGEWEYRDGTWTPNYIVVDTDDVHAVQRELDRQLTTFQDLTGRAPTHIDSHQHVHRSPALLPIFEAMAHKTGALLREGAHGIHYDGRLYGWDGRGVAISEATGVPALVEIIGSIGPGVTELGCHPGLGDHIVGSYRAERLVETATLCDARVVQAMIDYGVELSSFHDARAHLA